MIKTNKNLVEVPETVIADNVLTVLTTMGNRELRRATEEVRDYERNIERIQNNVRDKRHNINSYHRDIYQLKEREREEKRRLIQSKAALAGIDSSEAETKAKANIDNAKKLRYVESIDIGGDNIVVQTRLIFTDIRKESGSRESQRRCLGAFKLTLNFADNGVSIENILFTRPQGHDHWAIRNASPCQGEHRDRFNEAFRAGDLFMLLETCFHFLRSTDDGGAYESSDSWLYNRDESFRRGTPNVRKGSYVFVHEDYDQFSATEHCNYAQIMRCDRGNIYLEFKESFEFGHTLRGLAKEGRGYRVPATAIRKITAKEYQDESLDLETVRKGNPLEAIDALPDGSSLSDANNLL